MINFERLIYMRQPFLRKVLTGILMRELSQRTSQFTDSVIRRMTRVANKYGAVNLSQGFPDFDPPEAITDRLAEVAAKVLTSMRLHGEQRISGMHLRQNRSIFRE